MKGELEVPVSLAELLDKITILEIKLESIEDAEKLKNVSFELRILNEKKNEAGIESAGKILELQSRLKELNKLIWDGEDSVRNLDHKNNFGQEFIDIARSIRQWNDARAKIKREINIFLGSSIIEEKNHFLR